MSISRLCVRISNCSRDFLSTCGDRSTVQRLMVVGRGIGPGHIRAGALGRLHNFLRGLVQNAVVVRFQTNTNFVALSHLVIPQPSLNPHYSMISVTAPAPTVWPPSRIAKRKPFSKATGVISVTSQLTLSPGITISTPVGSFTSPVTSVVRK